MHARRIISLNSDCFSIPASVLCLYFIISDLFLWFCQFSLWLYSVDTHLQNSRSRQYLINKLTISYNTFIKLSLQFFRSLDDFSFLSYNETSSVIVPRNYFFAYKLSFNNIENYFCGQYFLTSEADIDQDSSVLKFAYPHPIILAC